MKHKLIYTLAFSDITLQDVPRVGGKNASLGELYSSLKSKGIGALDGFATTGGLVGAGLACGCASSAITCVATKTKAAIGKLLGTIGLAGMDLKVKPVFASIIFTPLDDQPLVQSKRILITAEP